MACDRVKPPEIKLLVGFDGVFFEIRKFLLKNYIENLNLLPSSFQF